MTPTIWDYSTATELQQALVARKVSSIELVENAIARIEALNHSLNAITGHDFECAREAARRADAALSRGEQGPMLGIPITVKDAFNVTGLPTTWGNPKFEDYLPQEDAVVVSRLKRAGAVILGKTNVPLQLGDMQSYNDIWGTTNNPWDPNRTSGGSSGGSAAALAAGFGPISLGSDLGGSIRVPAHFCGVYAHKPSQWLIPDRGHTPPMVRPTARDPDLSVVGPMARSAADLSLALDVMAGPDEDRAGVGFQLALRPARCDHLKTFRVLVIDTHPLVPTGHAVRGALSELSERLAMCSATVAHTSPLLPNLAEAAKVFARLWSAFRGAIVPREIYDQMCKAAQGLDETDDSLAANRIRGAVMSHRVWFETDGARNRIRQQWRELFREWDIVVCPAMPTVAFAHDHSLPIEARRLDIDGESYPYRDTQLVWSELATSSGLPSTVMPIGRTQDGLPIGVQVIGPYLEDRTPIAFAALAEREFGGFTPPPLS